MKENTMPIPEDAETKIYNPKYAPGNNFTSTVDLKYEVLSDDEPVKIYHHTKNINYF